jgi:hypothetical protein
LKRKAALAVIRRDQEFDFWGKSRQKPAKAHKNGHFQRKTPRILWKSGFLP